MFDKLRSSERKDNIMLLIAVYLTMAIFAAIGIAILVLRNRDILFPKHKKTQQKAWDNKIAFNNFWLCASSQKE